MNSKKVRTFLLKLVKTQSKKMSQPPSPNSNYNSSGVEIRLIENPEQNPQNPLREIHPQNRQLPFQPVYSGVTIFPANPPVNAPLSAPSGAPRRSSDSFMLPTAPVTITAAERKRYSSPTGVNILQTAQTFQNVPNIQENSFMLLLPTSR